MSFLIEKMNAGGIFMYAILAVGVVITALMADRSLALYRSWKKAPSDIRIKLMNFIALGQFNEAKSYVEMAASNTSLGRVVTAGINVRHIGGGDEEVQARMDEALSQEISQIDRRNGFLAVFGNISTLLGLLGTVTGLIQSFTGVTNANPAERAILLGQGISEALNTTAFGLAVAIPALVAYAIFQNRTDRLIGHLTEESSKIFHDLLFHADSRRQLKTKDTMNARPAIESLASREN